MRRPISNKELAANIQTEIEQSGNWAGSEDREAIKESLNYLLLRNKGDEIDGRSQIQSGDVADMLDHVQAELQPMYAVPQLVEISPEGPQDTEEEARVETEAINWYFRERMRGFKKLDQSVQDGLLSRTGYLKIWYRESYGLPYEEELSGDQLQIDAQLTELSQENEVEILEETMVQEASYMQLAPIATAMGEVYGGGDIIEVQPAQYSVKVKVTPLHKEVVSDSVAPEDMFISKDAVSSDLQQPRFVAQRRRMARMDVRAEGFDYDQVARMPQTSTYDSDVRTARQSDYNTYSRQAAHESGQQVDLYECYYKVDRSGNGIPELIKVYYGWTGELMRMEGESEPYVELVRVRPFASGSPLMVAHRHQGRSPCYDKEKQVEDSKRVLIRQMLDNMYLANDSNTVVARNVAPEDMEETESGKIIWADNPGADVVPLKHNNIAGDSLQALGYMDKIRDERAGSSIRSGSENQPVNQAAHTTERVMSAMERLVAMYARNFANSLIRDAFVLLHQQMKLLPGKVSFQNGDSWMETEPRYWIDRTRISVTLGKGEGEKMRKSGALRELIEIQRQDSAGPYATLVSPSAAYEARIDLARNAGLDEPTQYWVDPESPEGQQAAQQAAQRAMEDRQAAMMANQMQYQTMLAITQMQEQTKRMSDQSDAVEGAMDRFVKFVTEMTKIEAQTGEDLPQGLLGDDVPNEGMIQ